MKVLLITGMFPTPPEAFNGISIHQTIKALERHRHQFKVIYPIPRAPGFMNRISSKAREYSAYPNTWSYEGIQIAYPRHFHIPRRILSQHRGRFMLSGIRKTLYEEFKDFNPDLIWAQPGVNCGNAARLLSRKTDIPYFIIVHGGDINNSMHLPRERKVLHKVYRDAAKVVGVSKRMERGVRQICPAADTTVINNGISFSELEPYTGSTGSKSEHFTIISVSNLIESKGIQFNLKALADFRKIHKNCQYWIIGEGPYRCQLEKMADDLDLRASVHFLGQLNRPQVLEKMAEADIFSLPSYLEGFGLVYLEAMGLGKPVIGIDNQGITDVIKHGEDGFLIPPQSAEELVEIWGFAAKNPEKAANIGKRASDLVRDHYDWRIISEKYDAMFSDIAR